MFYFVFLREKKEELMENKKTGRDKLLGIIHSLRTQ